MTAGKAAVGQEAGIFDVLEGTPPTGVFPLNENHWSNVLAWLLSKQTNPATADVFLETLAALAEVGVPESDTWEVLREAKISERRRIDILLQFGDKSRWLIETKVDPSYQDQWQVSDEAAVLGANDYLVIVGPVGLDDLSTEMVSVIRSDARIRLVLWRDLADRCEQMLGLSSLGMVSRCVLYGMARYWRKESGPAFDGMVKTIVAENGWETFYPDDFKQAFIARFPDVWEQSVAQRGLSGQGNAHQQLTQALSGLCQRKSGFRLQKTGNSRAPKPSDWGFPLIYEYEVVIR
jgi:hypothetical protein